MNCFISIGLFIHISRPECYYTLRLIRNSQTEWQIPMPSSALVPRPSSSIMMSDLSLAECIMYDTWQHNEEMHGCSQHDLYVYGNFILTSFISTINVDELVSKSSSTPIRVKIWSATRKEAYSAGTNDPKVIIRAWFQTTRTVVFLNSETVIKYINTNFSKKQVKNKSILFTLYVENIKQCGQIQQADSTEQV